MRTTSRIHLHRSLLGLALLAVGVQAAAADDLFTPWHVAKTRVVSSVAPSPDGSRIAYLLAVPRDPLAEADGPAWQELHVVDVATAKDVAFVTAKEAISQPRWTPDGTAVSFLAKRGADKARSLYAIPVAGGEARRVLGHETDIRGYEWSPDGGQVAFLATPPGPKEVEELKK